MSKVSLFAIKKRKLLSANKNLTRKFFNRTWVFESLSHSVFESPASQQEEQSQTQLKDKGEHAQQDYGVGNC